MPNRVITKFDQDVLVPLRLLTDPKRVDISETYDTWYRDRDPDEFVESVTGDERHVSIQVEPWGVIRILEGLDHVMVGRLSGVQDIKADVSYINGAEMLHQIRYAQTDTK